MYSLGATFVKGSVTWQMISETIVSKASKAACDKRYQLSHKEQIYAQQAVYRRTHPLAVAATKRRTKLHCKFGLSVDQYEVMLDSQEGKCALCPTTPEVNKRRLAVDHDHKSGQIRGLLCNRCNMAIGLLDESVARLKQVLNYLTLRGGEETPKPIQRLGS